MPLRTPEKKSPLSGEGRLFSSPAESDGVENFDDSKLARIGPARMREVGAMSPQELLRKDVRRDLLKPGLIRN